MITKFVCLRVHSWLTRGSAFGFALLLLISGPLILHAQPAPASHVLDLDGRDSYVELPDDIFQELTEGTVEAWIFADHWNGIQRFFNFGEYEYDMGVGRPLNKNSGLQFFISQIDLQSETVVQSTVPAREWLHLAAVSGPGGMELYLNGLLLGSAPFTGSFNSISGKQNYIGAWHRAGGAGLDAFSGRIGEFRVWKSRRSGA
jgi:hypothetical protein